MTSATTPIVIPPPQSKVRVRIAGRAEVSEGVLERFSEAGVLVKLKRAPDLGIMTLLEFVGPDESVLLRRTACVVFRRSSGGNDSISAALEFVDLGPSQDPAQAGLLARFLGLFTRKKSLEAPTDDDGPNEADLPTEGPVVGIDLGTSTSCAALVVEGKARVVEHPNGTTIPSVVHFDTSGRRRVGESAKEKIPLEPTRTVFGSKRFLGRPFTSQEVRRWGHFFPYQMVQGVGGATAVKIGHELHSLEEVAAEILRAVKRRAETIAGQPVHRAVISVPAYFGEPQRMAVRRAGRLARLRVERIVNEPTAAAVAFGFGRALSSTVLVFDLGGGTFDVSILRIEGDKMQVLATGGDPFLGGSDFDDRLTELAFTTFENKTGTHLRDDYAAVQRVRFGAEQAKIQLSQAENAVVDVPNAAVIDGQPIDFKVEVSREMYTSVVGDLVDRALAIVGGVLKQAGLQGKDIDEVVMVGGQTRSPVVRERVLERFGKKMSKRVHAEEAVAIGAALIGESIARNLSLDLRDVLTASIWMRVNEQPAKLVLSHGVSLPASIDFEVPEVAADEEVLVRLYRGESEQLEDNAFIGSLSLDAGMSRARGMLNVDENGLLSVEIEDRQGERRELRVSMLDQG